MYMSISKYMHVIPVWYRRQALKENFGTMKEKKTLKTNSHSHNQMLHCYQWSITARYHWALFRIFRGMNKMYIVPCNLLFLFWSEKLKWVKRHLVNKLQLLQTLTAVFGKQEKWSHNNGTLFVELDRNLMVEKE